MLIVRERAVLLAFGVATRKPTERIVRRHDFGLPFPPVCGREASVCWRPLFRELAPNQGMDGIATEFIAAWAAVVALGHQLCHRLRGLGWRTLESLW